MPTKQLSLQEVKEMMEDLVLRSQTEPVLVQAAFENILFNLEAKDISKVLNEAYRSSSKESR
jgi:hypothetical protein